MARDVKNISLLAKMAVDLYRGSTADFSADQVNETLRIKMLELCGGDKFDYKAFRRNKIEVFEVIEEALDIIIGSTVEEQFGRFADIRNVDYGDTVKFELPDHQNFHVSLIADGTGNLRRQRLDTSYVTVSVANYGVKIYEEFLRFLAGRINWSEMVNRVARSFTHDIAVKMYDAIYAAYSDIAAPYKLTGVFNLGEYNTLVEHVEAANDGPAMVWGTKNALSKIAPGVVSDAMADQRNSVGYYATVDGTTLMQLRQGHRHNTNTFAINDNFLLIVPQGRENIVKMVTEGGSLIQEVAGGVSADMSIEYMFQRKYGLALLGAFKYGIYRLA